MRRAPYAARASGNAPQKAKLSEGRFGEAEPERNLTIAEKCAAVSRREDAQIAMRSSARAKRSGPKAPRAGGKRDVLCARGSTVGEFSATR